MKPTRGERNNNPGNVRLSSTKWQGQVPGPDKSFCTFATPQLGIRCLTKVLLTYYRKYKLTTVAEIIHRWAPTVENDTAAYIKSCCAAMCVSEEEKLNLHEFATMKNLVIAIIKHENGRCNYLDDVVNEGVRLALQ